MIYIGSSVNVGHLNKLKLHLMSQHQKYIAWIDESIVVNLPNSSYTVTRHGIVKEDSMRRHVRHISATFIFGASTNKCVFMYLKGAMEESTAFWEMMRIYVPLNHVLQFVTVMLCFY